MNTIQELLRLAQNPVVQAAIASLLGLGGAYKKHQKTGRLRVKELPLRAFRQLIYAIRGAYFEKPKPRKTTTVQVGIEDAIKRLEDQHFEDGWYLSYQYAGEDANLRRPEGEDGEVNQQFHVRLWDNGDGTTDVAAHIEPSPLQHPRLHLQERGLVVADERAAALLS